MKDMYLLHHEEIEALAANIPHVKRIRFFMTFGQSYLTHMKCLENVGMLRTDPVEFNGQEIVPIQFLKALLPDPASLGPRTVGKTNIGCIFTGIKDGKEKKVYIYNVCDHQECYREVGSQAISYTTGVPAMIGIEAEKVNKLSEGRPNILDLITNGNIDIIVNSPVGKDSVNDDSYLRKGAIKAKIPYYTTIAAAKAAAEGIAYVKAHQDQNEEVNSLQGLHAQISDKF